MRALLWLATWLLLSAVAGECDRRDLAEARRMAGWSSVAAVYGAEAERELYGTNE